MFSPGRSDDIIESVETVTSVNIDAPMECGGEYTQDTGKISSPGYPVQNYSFESNCMWSIKVDEGKVLVMNFEYMDIEIGPPDCPFDGVIVVDDSDLDPIPFVPGADPFGALWTHPPPQVLGIFCGNEMFKPFVSVTNSVRVGFYSDSDTERSGFVLTWRTVDAKPIVHQSCDFEGGLCEGWQNVETGDNFDWTIFSGQTPSSGTGPHFDHTKLNTDGVYAYIESSRPRLPNDIALLISPETKFREDDSDYCLDFWYHMHGGKMGSLGAGLLIGNRQERKWVKSGNQGNEWNHESITINKIVSPFKIIFAGVVGQNHEGDIAIDDIKLYGKPCSELTWKDRMPLLDEEVASYTAPCVEENEFRCKNASCISKQKLCDGIVHCPQMDDEDSSTCKNTTYLPPPIEATSDTLLEETTDGDTIEESTSDDSTSFIDTTPDFIDITTEDSEKFVQETTAALPRETTRVKIGTTSPIDTSALDSATQYTDRAPEDTTVVLPRETVNLAVTTTTIALGPSVTTDLDLTTVEDDVTTTDELDTTDTDTSLITTDSDRFTTPSAIATDADTTVSDLATKAISRTNDVVKAQKEQVTLSATATPTQSVMVGDATTKSRAQSLHKTTDSAAVTTDFSSDDSTFGKSGKPSITVETQKVEHVFTPTTAMVLLNKLEVSTRSSFVTPTPKTTILKSELVTIIAQASSPELSRTSTVKTRKGTTQSHHQTAAILPKTTDTTTRRHVVGNMEVPTMADKQKGENGSSMTSPTSLCVLIGMLFSLANTL